MSGPLTPIYLSNNGTGVALACTSSSGGTRVPLLGDGDSLVVTNIGGSTGFLALGGPTGFSAVAPGATASYPILVGTKEDQIVIARDESYFGRVHVAGVCKAGETTTLIVHLVER